MGFKMPRTVYNLVFDGTDFEGLSIKVEAMTMDERLHAFFDLAPAAGDTAVEQKEKQDKRFQMLVDHVVEWDLEDRDGNPVPVTVEGLFKACEPEQAGAILGAWSSGRQSIPAPLAPKSPATSLSEIPMTVQPSTPVPV